MAGTIIISRGKTSIILAEMMQVSFVVISYSILVLICASVTSVVVVGSVVVFGSVVVLGSGTNPVDTGQSKNSSN